MRLNKLEKTAVDALEDIKGRDIVAVDVRKLTSLFDTIIIATADSARQAKAMSNNVQEKVKAIGKKVQGVEGEQVGDWVLVDLGDVVVHIMQTEVRAHYNLEELWTPPKTPRKRTREATPAAE